MALGFAEAGADVVVASRKLDACEAVADEVRAIGSAGAGGELPRRRLGPVRRARRRDRRRVRPHRRAREQRRHRAGPAVAARRHRRPVRQDDRGQPQGSVAAHRARGRAHAAGRLDHQHQLEGVAAPDVRSPSSTPRPRPGSTRSPRRPPRSSGRAASGSTPSSAARSTPTASTRPCRPRSCRRRWRRHVSLGRIASRRRDRGHRALPRERRVVVPDRRAASCSTAAERPGTREAP